MAKNKGNKEFEAWANKELKKIQKLLLMDDFTIGKIKSSGHATTSTSEYRYPYKDVEIEYSDSLVTLWKRGEKKEAFAVLLHEMIHPITDKLYGVGYDRFASKSQIENEREQLTDHFTNVLMKAIYDRK